MLHLLSSVADETRISNGEIAFAIDSPPLAAGLAVQVPAPEGKKKGRGNSLVSEWWWSAVVAGRCQFTKSCTHTVAGNKTMLQHQVIKREGRAGGDREEPALLRGVQHGAIAVNRYVRAGGDGDLRTVVAAEVGGERHRDRSAVRDDPANLSPRARGRGEAVPAVRNSSDRGLACAGGGQGRESIANGKKGHITRGAAGGWSVELEPPQQCPHRSAPHETAPCSLW